ncbi:alkanesulfonate monooxygenase SsuD/methylene tetrahydromethanopterin reductase-like flavin-dependent oxidoreductase (luciferase family) [Motilibacter rhizosphaerae]|uniref:Alkanesulfonate monooxygenase SsuD/methylene tetrahydromethanopterin reductase-like flavin-dependent oxidoreductase (Luciferase family) n=1 Tax=Motilibacter rhizosphaerae TaxID=598652 RepID=A0A4Q7NQ64_9ACTN|nr:LLM class flavin-dependent oxidoreductase [Motilibacter rhizosphaerae]RZS87474.1 alkanesulfonate monooxygenase SsuD/methylene tetrahydromethanopterin reductase-like flavin-dependent oxidoreductase (luciferase family) [Motilibacter rhizosphaerae]
MTTIGTVFLPGLPPEQLRRVAEAAEAAGLEELWLWEDCFREAGVSAAAAALAWTSRLRVGVGLLPVPLRNVALTAMEAATLERLFPGRLRLGIGHGVLDWMGQVGARVESPMTLLQEHAEALRDLLAGERVTRQGRYVRLDGVALDWPPSAPPELLVGGIGKRTLALAGRVSEGALLVFGLTPAAVAAATGHVATGRAESGRPGAPRVVASLLTATGPGAAERIRGELARWEIAPSDDVAVAGDAEQVAARVRRLADAGATTVVLQPTVDDPDPREFARFAAQEVQPLVGAG